MEQINSIPFFGKERYYEVHSKGILDIVHRVYTSGKVLMGPEIEQFEKNIAEYCGRKHAIAVGSCTDALYFSLLSAGIKPGDEVLVTGFSFIASASCISHIGAVPVFVDIDPKTYLMDLSDLKRKITDKTKAIVAVHLFGNALNIESVEEIGRKHNLVVIEDAAQSIGSNYNDRKVGTMGLCSCISFDPTKILSAQSNGGVVLTDNAEAYDYISRIRYHGKNVKMGTFDDLGFNSRISTLQAAILSYNLAHLEKWIERHREIAHKYIEGLKDIPQITLPLERNETRHIFHKFVMQVQDRVKFNSWLTHHKIPTAIHYEKAIPDNPLFRNLNLRADGLDHINDIKQKVISLPINPWLKDEEIDYIIKSIRMFYNFV